jgi:hypothetical protein
LIGIQDQVPITITPEGLLIELIVGNDTARAAKDAGFAKIVRYAGFELLFRDPKHPQHSEKRHDRRNEVSIDNFPSTTVVSALMPLGLLDDNLGLIVFSVALLFFVRLDRHFQLLFLAAANVFQLSPKDDSAGVFHCDDGCGAVKIP